MVCQIDATQNLEVKNRNRNSQFKSDIKNLWHRFNLGVTKLRDTLPKEASAKIITEQLLKSSANVPVNLIDKTASSSRFESKKIHDITFKSSNKAKYWLGLLRGSNKTNKTNATRITPLVQEVTDIANMLAAGVLGIKGNAQF